MICTYKLFQGKKKICANNLTALLSIAPFFYTYLSICVELVDCDDHRNTKKVGIFNLFPQVTKTLFDQVKIFVEVFCKRKRSNIQNRLEKYI